MDKTFPIYFHHRSQPVKHVEEKKYSAPMLVVNERNELVVKQKVV